MTLTGKRGALAKGDGARGFARFVSVGAVATIIYLLAYLALDMAFGIPAVTASAAAYLMGMAASWFGQSRFTFRDASRSNRDLLRFVLTSIYGSAVAIVAVQFAESGLGIPPFWGALFTCAFVPVASFLAMNFWVFHNPGATSKTSIRRGDIT